MNETDWAKIEDSENDAAYAPAPKPYRPTTTADAFLMGGGYVHEEDPDPDEEKGPWFAAEYPGQCSACYLPFTPGDMIRADGEGDWEAKFCLEDH